jgi:putative nucleotidyltransferase with HDIG domain
VLSVAIGRVLKLPAADLEALRLGALLHDIGKTGVPDDVLSKPGPLTSSEYDIIKQHPSLGARILRSVPFLAPHIPIVELHHERPDGRGYPHGLHDADIPLAARIVHAADAYDAMTSARAYRAALPARHALRELWRCAGSEFHADIVGALMTACAAAAFVCAAAATARAQESARFGLHSTIAADLFPGANTVVEPNIVVDVTALARVAEGWTVYVRPWFRQPRLPGMMNSENWDKEIYQAAVQYERAGRRRRHHHADDGASVRRVIRDGRLRAR